MKVNKVVLQNDQLQQVAIDLTQDTVTTSDVARGKIFHLPNGETAEGTLIVASNIEYYKFQDLERIVLSGGTLATDLEYEEAEVYLQQVYKNIMEGSNG